MTDDGCSSHNMVIFVGFAGPFKCDFYALSRLKSRCNQWNSDGYCYCSSGYKFSKFCIYCTRTKHNTQLIVTAKFFKFITRYVDRDYILAKIHKP